MACPLTVNPAARPTLEQMARLAQHLYDDQNERVNEGLPVDPEQADRELEQLCLRYGYPLVDVLDAYIEMHSYYDLLSENLDHYA